MATRKIGAHCCGENRRASRSQTETLSICKAERRRAAAVADGNERRARILMSSAPLTVDAWLRAFGRLLPRCEHARVADSRRSLSFALLASFRWSQADKNGRASEPTVARDGRRLAGGGRKKVRRRPSQHEKSARAARAMKRKISCCSAAATRAPPHDANRLAAAFLQDFNLDGARVKSPCK